MDFNKCLFFSYKSIRNSYKSNRISPIRDILYHHTRKPFGVRISTDLPEGPGLGSSTSFAVCLAACFLHWRCLQGGHHIGFDDEQLRTIKRYTESCEDVMQEDVFPWIDAEICIYGNIRTYQCTHYKSLFTSIINLQTVIKILIIATRCYQNKKTRAQLIAKMKSSHPDFDSIINKLDEFATTIYDRLDYINCNRDNVHPITHVSAYENAYMDLQDDIRRNQQLLKEYHLSYPNMDNKVSKIASGFGYGAKITGFGGGFAYIVLQPNITDMEMDFLREAFHSKIFKTVVATIDCEGVKIDN
ncbi:mevalonate kinase-like [Nylanderia fulva]|uniref:mevalonate kinase-like n=1 Tax=Nylanderia fulva TaxID=613905 RepID=UPI0010FB999F|nr:mevalonate kinase-like [Nylanderia fulva]